MGCGSAPSIRFRRFCNRMRCLLACCGGKIVVKRGDGSGETDMHESRDEYGYPKSGVDVVPEIKGRLPNPASSLRLSTAKLQWVIRKERGEQFQEQKILQLEKNDELVVLVSYPCWKEDKRNSK